MEHIIMGIAIVLLVVGVGIFIGTTPMKDSKRSVRLTVISTVLSLAGIILVIVGALVTGLTDLLLQGVRGVIDWVRHKPMDTATWVGIAVGVLGLIVYLIGGFIKAPTREEVIQRQATRAAKDRQRLAGQAAKSRQQQAKNAPAKPQQPPPLPAASQQAGPAGSTPASADDEVANILKKHGIE